MNSTDRAAKLIQDANDDRERFVTLAQEVTAEAIAAQYPRLRGFAMMAQKTQVSLTLRVNFDFARVKGGVVVEATATPAPVIERFDRRLKPAKS
jgi:hypothetical protein